jgi:hypothetical protein
MKAMFFLVDKLPVLFYEAHEAFCVDQHLNVRGAFRLKNITALRI